MSTIKQKSAFVETEGGKRVEVRRMRWKGARDFLRSLARVVMAAYPPENAAMGLPLAATILGNLKEIVTGSDELATLLCVQSTGLTVDEFDELDALSACRILEESLKINCDDEIKKCLAGIAESVAGLIQQHAPTSPPPEPAQPTTTQ